VSNALGPGADFGSYRIESLLGRGGMSVVYLAEDRRLGRQVAIKVLSTELASDEAFRTRFIRESQLAAGLEHQNIVPIYEAGEVDGHMFIAMRYVRGTDLRVLISNEGPLGPDRTIRLLRPIAAALDTAHRRGLVHRDVKPANILVAVDEEGEHPYLSDFGLTKHTSSKSGLTKTGQFMGTVDYVAPEQIKGEEVDGRTDEYALACVVYQCLSGRVPFDKPSDVATMFGHLQDPPPRVSAARSDVSFEFDDVVATGMAKEREARHPTCTAMLDALSHAAGLPSGPRPTPGFDPTVVAMPPQPGTGPLLPPAPEVVPSAAPVPPVSTPTTGPAPEEGTGGGRNARLLAIVGGAIAAIVALVVVVLSLGGGSEPGPGPGPTTGPPEPTGPSPPTTLSNADAFSIPRLGAATLYPSPIEVADLRGVVTDVTVTLNGFTHSFPADIDLLLVGPEGQSVLLMEGVGGTTPVSGVTVTFSDDGVPLSDVESLTSGTARPSSFTGDGFGFEGPAPAPTPPHGTEMTVFDGTDPNGTWSLFVFDDGDRDRGQITGGWTLDLVMGTGVTSPTGPTGVTGVTGANVIFQDDFSDPTSGWDVFSVDTSSGGYRDGAYVLSVIGGFNVGGDANTSTQELSSLGDVRIEATAGPITGTRSAVYGLMCRAVSPTEHYYFLIQGDGTYFIGEASGDVATNLDTGFSPAIVGGAGPNRIAAECVDGREGVTLRMTVNGVAVNTVIDPVDPLGPGATGFRVESRRAFTEVAFDDYVVTPPA